MSQWRLPVVQYGVALVSFAVAFAATWLLRAQMYPSLSPLFLAATTLAAWFGGLGPGLLVTGLSGAAMVGMLAWTGELNHSPGGNFLWAGSFLLVALLASSLSAARKRAEDALRERDLRLRLVSEQIPAALWSTDTELRLTSGFGARFTRAPGGGGESLYSLFNTTDPLFAPIAAHRAALAGESVSYEFEFEGRTHQARVEPLRNAEGHIMGVVGVALDITERKVAEETLRQAKQLAEQASAARDQFLAMLSHELRTPLTPALAAASALEGQTDLPPELRSSLDMIRRNIELEAALIDDLLDLTRIQKGKFNIKREHVSIHSLLQDVVHICQDEIAAKGVDVTLELRARLHHVKGDGARLRQVFWNLIKNGIKFTPRGGRVCVVTGDEGGVLRVEVADTGIGIEPEVLPRVFEAFEQGRRAITQKFGGLGLGLAICRALVEAHGGNIVAHSAGAGRGASFTVALQAEDTPDTIDPGDHQPVGRREFRALRLLLVEDHEDTMRVLSRLLTGLGHSVRGAGSVEAALRAAEEEQFDLIISDLGLPDGSGVDLMRRLTEQGPAKAIALTGYGMEADVQRCEEAGFARHITKPVNFGVLKDAIDELV